MFRISLSKRVRSRSRREGTVAQTRYVLDYRDPATGRRRQEFFTRKSDAETRRDLLQAAAASRPEWPVGASPAAPAAAPPAAPQTPHAPEMSVGKVVEYWLESLDGGLKASTRDYYHRMARYILAPIPVGSGIERRRWSRQGHVPVGVATMQPLGPALLVDLSAQMIRAWHAMLVTHVGHHTAHAAKKVLGSALRLAAEELNVRPPPVPRTLARRKGAKQKKRTLTLQQVAVLIAAAWEDEERGIYYAFPFLTGVRPSEQLGLLWRDVDLAKGSIAIRRMQELDGTLCDFTKTEASTREIPIPPLLRRFLERWRALSPTRGKPDTRVFVTLGSGTSARHARVGEPLTYWNFRNTYWRPVLGKLGLPPVAPHSARHTFISTLQAKGTEVGLVAKLAGHANPNITLGYYTQAVRNGIEPMRQLEQVYLGSSDVHAEPPAQIEAR